MHPRRVYSVPLTSIKQAVTVTFCLRHHKPKQALPKEMPADNVVTDCVLSGHRYRLPAPAEETRQRQGSVLQGKWVSQRNCGRFMFNQVPANY
jgi:hypothetical protein